MSLIEFITGPENRIEVENEYFSSESSSSGAENLDFDGGTCLSAPHLGENAELSFTKPLRNRIRKRYKKYSNNLSPNIKHEDSIRGVEMLNENSVPVKKVKFKRLPICDLCKADLSLQEAICSVNLNDLSSSICQKCVNIQEHSIDEEMRSQASTEEVHHAFEMETSLFSTDMQNLNSAEMYEAKDYTGGSILEDGSAFNINCCCFSQRESVGTQCNQSSQGYYSPYNIERKLLAARQPKSRLHKFWKSNKWCKILLFISIVTIVIVLSAVYIY